MVSRWYRLAGGVLLAAAVAVLSGPALGADDDDPKATKKAGQEVLKLVGGLDKPGVEDQAKAIAKANEIERVMRQFKTRKDGGMGVGANGPKILGMPDGYELAIIAMAKKSPSAADLKANQEDLLKMAQVSQAIAEINYNYKVPKPKKPGVVPANYKQWNDEMKASSKELADAIKASDPKKVEAAATKLTAACNNCHTGFRD
jgi:hypothetical protein